ncbi:hypothetical protein [Candidatus Mycoplasma haematohominis]|uniref:Uncharacterized protein n=1 Tax=Candidatus Mycoplasma haematohominis TaxID=1494318 RepID=A0A478FSC4_9MOLU|nr:hypothetical protein [Candidatus Mycoplasma haemohominis]GCE63359.1 hypothetical protein MHSWG343_03500 [Candidatus Mycoplasma haemohominis]
MSDIYTNLGKGELNRLAVLKRYAVVAYELPLWARTALESRMGSVEVSVKDSFELYLISLKGAVPRFDYVSFQKKFVEIFQRRAFKVLQTIIDNREKRQDYFVSNDYFWQEFRELFDVNPKTSGNTFLSNLESTVWNAWNKYVKGVFGFQKNVAKVGVSGLPKGRWLVSPKSKTQVQEVKWN